MVSRRVHICKDARTGHDAHAVSKILSRLDGQPQIQTTTASPSREFTIMPCPTHHASLRDWPWRNASMIAGARKSSGQKHHPETKPETPCATPPNDCHEK
ncbi:hypothetical protein ACRALDRAFT_1073799, partial [Sodiomyces alcalophilus JCM 7366]|uniref:uncharacterized protein n=1 Tax=Sodiomyces alcalophilus JCM 7366 TaxID=591952 RepID=UPI0039B52F46